MRASDSRLLFLLASALAAAPDVYYVSASGDDLRGDGSPARPWASITAAVPKIPDSGGLLIVRDGLYRGPVLIARKFRHWLVIQAENPYRAVLRSDHSLTLFIMDSANVLLTGFDIARGTPYTTAPLAVHIARSENIGLLNNILHDSFNNDILKMNEGCRRLLVEGNLFFNQQGSAGQHIDSNGCREVWIRENVFFNDGARSPLKNLRTTHGFIVAKDSGEVRQSRSIWISSNVFLNFEGSPGSNFILLGEDGKPFYEVEEVTIENNLLLGNSPCPMRAPLGVKGARQVLFRNNTVVGDLPGRAFAARINRELRTPVNRQLAFLNNIWSDPTGTMGTFAEVPRGDAEELALRNNLYWNGGKPIPRRGGPLDPAGDPRRLFADPRLPPARVVLPHWDGARFASGAALIRQEFERLVRQHGAPAPGAPGIGRAEPAAAPAEDILGAPRNDKPDLGAVQFAGVGGSLRLVLLPDQVSGRSQTVFSHVILNRPATARGTVVTLVSAQPALAAVPKQVLVAQGQTAAFFPITTAAVTAPSRVSIQAAAGGSRASATLVIVPAPTPR